MKSTAIVTIYPSEAEVSMAFFQPTTAAALALCATIAVFVGLKQRKHGNPLPPGPKKRFIIGNLLDMPTHREWETFARWSEEYGSDVIHVQALGNSIVILNSFEAAEELLDKRSGIYSSRPHMTLLHELSGAGFGFGLLPYGETWRVSRKLMVKHLNPSNPELNQPREIKYVGQFVVKLLDDPENFMDHIRHVVGANALSSVYGLSVRPKGDPYLAGADRMVRDLSMLLVAGGYMVDVIPALKYLPTWFPGATFHQVAGIIRGNVPLVRERPFAATQEMMKTGSDEPSLAMNGLKEIDEYSTASSEQEQLELLKDVCAQAFIAAADTTVSSVGTFFLAMVMYPEVQRKAQEELDKVLDGRLPDHRDLENLPYLNAIVLEVFRWHPVLPLTIAHVVIGDDIYKGYHIPGNSIVIPNQWKMLHDEQVYPEPFVFKPERFLKDGEIDPSVRTPLDMAFGFGRRICPGQYLARSMVSITAATVLSSFSLLKQIDKEGNPIQPKEEYHLAAVSQPLPFPCRIVPRSTEAAARIESLRAD